MLRELGIPQKRRVAHHENTGVTHQSCQAFGKNVFLVRDGIVRFLVPENYFRIAGLPFSPALLKGEPFDDHILTGDVPYGHSVRDFFNPGLSFLHRDDGLGRNKPGTHHLIQITAHQGSLWTSFLHVVVNRANPRLPTASCKAFADPPFGIDSGDVGGKFGTHGNRFSNPVCRHDHSLGGKSTGIVKTSLPVGFGIIGASVAHIPPTQ